MPSFPTNPQPPRPDVARYAEPRQVGIDADGKPLYGWPAEHRPTTVVHHHHAAPVRRGPQPGEVMGWVMVGGAVSATLVAVALSAIAIAMASVCVALAVLVLRHIWRDVTRR